MASKDTRRWKAVPEGKGFGVTNRNIYERVRPVESKAGAKPKLERVGSGKRTAALPYKVILTYQGRRYEKTASSLAAARRLRDEMEAALGKGIDPTEKPVSFADYADQWITTYTGKRGDLREETKLEYKDELDLAKRYFAGRTMASITADDAKVYVKFVRDTRGRQKRDKDGNVVKIEPAKASTIRNAVAPLRAMFFSAMASAKTTRVESNPFSRLGIAEQKKEVKATDRDALEELETGQAKAKAFTIAQLNRVLHELGKATTLRDGITTSKRPWPDGYWVLFGEFLAHTGLRISEAAALQWRHVDLDKGEVKVRQRLYRSPNEHGRREATIGAPKSRHSLREVPLSPGMVAKLKALKASRSNPKPSDPVFCSQSGGHLNPANVFNRHFKPAFLRARVDWAGFHTFRHTAASLLFREAHRTSPDGANASLLLVSRYLGHHSPSYTLNTYLHLIEDGSALNTSFFDEITGSSANGTKNGSSRTPQNRANGTRTRVAEKRSNAGKSRQRAERGQTG